MLRLLIPSDWPRTTTSCEWALLDDQGRVLQSGLSDPRTWPAATECEVVLSAEQCQCLQADLPPKAGKLADDVIVMSLEDRLQGDIADEHCVIGRNTASSVPVWMVRRQRVADIVSALGQAGRQVRRMVWEVHLVPLLADTWSVVIGPTRGFVRCDAHRGWVLGEHDIVKTRELAPEMTLALAAGSGYPRPQKLRCFASAQSLPAEQLEHWQRASGLPTEAVLRWDWKTVATDKAVNFLSGEFAPVRAGHLARRLRPAAWVLGLCGLIYGLLMLGDWGRLTLRERELRQQITATYQQSFPDARVMLDPYLQMQVDSRLALNRRGQLAADDFLALLAALPAAPDLRIVRMHYERQQLSIEYAGDFAGVDALRAALEARGLTLTAINDGGKPPRLLIGPLP